MPAGDHARTRVPGLLDGITLRSTPWTAERVSVPVAMADSFGRVAWKVQVAGDVLPLLSEPEGGFPRGAERNEILRHIGKHRPEL